MSHELEPHQGYYEASIHSQPRHTRFQLAAAADEEEEEKEEEEGHTNVQYIIPASIVLSISNLLFALLLLSPGDGLA